MKLIANSLMGATKVRSAQGFATPLSKAVTLGKRYRILFPVENDDLVIATVPGRNLDFDALGLSFVRLDDFDITETGKVTDTSVLPMYNRMARVIFDASYRQELAKAEEKAIADANALGESVEVESLAIAKQKIKEKYYGDRSDAKNIIYSTLNPVISGVVLETGAEAYMIPLEGEKNTPDWGSAIPVSVPLGKTKANQLTTILKSGDYFAKGSKWLEVEYAYMGSDKNEAGRSAVFGGVSSDNTLAKKFPDLWEANHSVIDNLVRSSEAIANRNSKIASRTQVDEVAAAFKKYVRTIRTTLIFMDLDDPEVKKTAHLFTSTGVSEAVPKIHNALLQIVEANTKVEEESIVDEISEAVANAENITTVSELLAQQDALGGALSDAEHLESELTLNLA